MRNYYQILGVLPSASVEEIKERYRFLVKAYHPDRFAAEKEKAQASKEMQLINEAYSVLSDSEKRAIYDRKIGVTAHESSQSGQTDTAEKMDERLKYIFSLMNKWDVFNTNLPNNSKRVQLIQELRISLADLSQLLRKIYPNSAHTIANDQISKSIAFIVAASIALGAEIGTNGLEKGFRQEDLEANLAVAGLVNWFALIDKASDNLFIQNQARRTLEIVYVVIKTCMDDGYRWALEKKKNQKDTAENITSSRQEGYCQFCFGYGRTVHVTFQKNIGMIFARSYQKIEGNFCGECVESHFWSFTMKTAIFGWWGVISMIVSPFIIILNIINYLIAIFSLGYEARLFPVKWGWKLVASAFIFLLLWGFSSTNAASLSQTVPKATNVSILAPNPQATRTPYPTSALTSVRPTKTSEPFTVKVVTPTMPFSLRNTIPSHCKRWSEITTALEGKTVCVYGDIYSVYWGEDGRFFIRFNPKDNNAFRFVVVYGYYDVQVGECVYATGVVKKYGKMPYIQLGERDFLYICD